MRLKKTLGMLVAAAMIGWQAPADAQIVPGTGQQLTEVADDFEDANWSFILNLPKASTNIDKVDRQPAGYSTNGLWFESTFRGTPDFVRRVETPEGGLPGSKGALALQTLYSGIPGQLSHKFQQDDLIANVSQKMGYMLPATWTPSYVVRVYIPPFAQWEQRIGSSFGFRADCQTIINKPTKVGRFFRTGGTTREIEQYWPGFFIQFNGRNHPQYTTQETATILIRSGERGEDITGPVITRPGWWTLGMTITPDGKVHYYGHEGVENLTARDHLYSNYPYGYKCLQTSTYFFNVVNQDDGRTWSTRWIVDDPKVYLATRPYTPQQTAQVPTRPVSQATPATPVTPPAAVPAKPAATLAPAAPVLPPANLTTPPSVPPVAPPVAPQLQNAPGVPSLPQLQSTPAAVTPNAALRLPSDVSETAARRVSALPPLSSTPIPVTPAKSAVPTPPAPAPALLTEEVVTESAPIAASVILSPAPAPIALPVEQPAAPASPPADDAPVLPPPPADLSSEDQPAPPAPAMPE
jgi:hypothetical protein